MLELSLYPHELTKGDHITGWVKDLMTDKVKLQVEREQPVTLSIRSRIDTRYRDDFRSVATYVNQAVVEYLEKGGDVTRVNIRIVPDAVTLRENLMVLLDGWTKP